MKSKRMVAIWKEGSRVLSRESHGTLRPAWWSEEQKEGPRNRTSGIKDGEADDKAEQDGSHREESCYFGRFLPGEQHSLAFESQDHSRSCWKLIVGHEWFIIQAGENGSLCLWDTVGLEMGRAGGCLRVRCKGRKKDHSEHLGLSSWRGWPFTGMRKLGRQWFGGEDMRSFYSSPYVTE